VSLPFAALVFQAARLRDRASGTGQPFVNQRILNEVEFPLVDFEGQARAVERYHSFQEAVSVALDSLRKVEQRSTRLRSSILAAAFSAKLIPQDPNDEPASILLDRIAAERASSGDLRPARSQRTTLTP
jgi:type I restriction enzyme S subunit